ncbi:MAG: cysteine rich repeat-containing protein [Leptospiraceae bacterium]|nr:cysteine rich repeat-containing protein [Leptospiraceae bacterium]MCZ8347338.1 cysteine rich repeat-containing protein [Leptospiraceae bacterium]
MRLISKEIKYFFAKPKISWNITDGGSFMILRTILVLGILFSSGSVFSFEDRKECAGDIKTLCAGKKSKERKECLLENKAQTTQACQAAIDKAVEKRNKKYPCAADRDKFCKDIKKGEGRIYNCLVENTAQLSPECSAKLTAKADKKDAKQKEREEKKEKAEKKKGKPPISDSELTD